MDGVAPISIDASALGFLNATADGRDTPQRRPSLKNFSRKRPEMTNLNHQYAIRRVFMRAVLDTEMAQPVFNSRRAGGSV